MAQHDSFVRIVRLPAVRMVRSGTASLDEFDAWWSAIKVPAACDLCPRDWMWWNPEIQALEWLYVLPEGVPNTSAYTEFVFPGGLYAVVACNDEDESMMAASQAIRSWLADSPVFEEDVPSGRYEMGHVTTPVDAKQTLGYHQSDIYVPIRVKAR